MLSQVSPFHSPCRMQVGRGQPSAMKLKCISVPRPSANIQPRRSYDSYPSSGGERERGTASRRFLSPHLLSARPRRGRGDGGMIFPRASARVRRQQTSLSRAKNDEILCPRSADLGIVCQDSKSVFTSGRDQPVQKCCLVVIARGRRSPIYCACSKSV